MRQYARVATWLSTAIGSQSSTATPLELPMPRRAVCPCRAHRGKKVLAAAEHNVSDQAATEDGLRIGFKQVGPLNDYGIGQIGL